MLTARLGDSFRFPAQAVLTGVFYANGETSAQVSLHTVSVGVGLQVVKEYVYAWQVEILSWRISLRILLPPTLAAMNPRTRCSLLAEKDTAGIMSRTVANPR